MSGAKPDPRAEDRALVLGDRAPAPDDENTVYIQFRRYDRTERRVVAVKGRNIVCNGFDADEVYAVVRSALIAHNSQLIEQARREAIHGQEESDPDEQHHAAAEGDGAEPEGEAGA